MTACNMLGSVRVLAQQEEVRVRSIGKEFLFFITRSRSLVKQDISIMLPSAKIEMNEPFEFLYRINQN